MGEVPSVDLLFISQPVPIWIPVTKQSNMTLNVPTYINLYGYGYRNVYELDELVNVNDRRISFEGSIVPPKKP